MNSTEQTGPDGRAFTEVLGVFVDSAGMMMNLKLEIRRNADGVTATDIWPNWEHNNFWWEEGNAHCDCNRWLFFVRARGEDDSAATECSHGLYSVRCTDADTGAVLYDEIETPNVRGNRPP